MKIGLNVSQIKAPDLGRLCRRAEEIGYSSLFIGEHIVVPAQLRTPYRGKINYSAMTYQYEVFGALSYIAAVTSKVRLGTGITILPIREPFQTARAITTVDVLSNGRVDVAIGAGSIPEEFEVMNADYATRGARMDEMVEIFTRLWTEKEVEHDGAFYKFRAVGFEPKPVQKPRPPIYVGSQSKAGIKRAARIADGWYGAVPNPEKAAEIISTIKGHMKDYGRDPTGFKYTLIHGAGSPVLPTADELKAYTDLGVETIVISVFDLEATDAQAKIEAAARTLKIG
jgi:probable F420-dependent oxidoreductase